MTFNATALAQLTQGLLGAAYNLGEGVSPPFILRALAPSVQAVADNAVLLEATQPIRSLIEQQETLSSSIHAEELTEAFRQSLNQLQQVVGVEHTESINVLSRAQRQLSPLDPDSRPDGMTLMGDDAVMPFLRGVINTLNTPAGIFEIPRDGGMVNLLMVNDVNTSISGFPESYMIKTDLPENIHPEDLPRFMQLVMDVVEKGKGFIRNLRLKISDGNYIWADIDAGRIEGTNFGLYVIMSKESLRQTIEGACPLQAMHMIGDRVELVGVEEQADIEKRCVLQNVWREATHNHAIIYFNEAGEPRIGSQSRVLEELLGYSREEIRNMPFKQLFPARNHEALQLRLSEFLEDGELHWRDVELVNKEGEEILVDIHAQASEVHGQTFAQAFFPDANERQAREQAQMDAESSDAFQVLIRQIFHDIKNTLGGIQGFLRLSLSGLLTLDENKFRHMVDQLGLIFGMMDDFSGIVSKEDARAVDLHSLLTELNIKSIRASVQTELSSQIKTSINLEKNPNMIPGPRSRLWQVVLNLIVNAFEAMIDGPTRHLTIATKNVSLTQVDMQRMGLDWQLLPKSPSSYLRFSVVNSGKGIPPEVLSRMFEAGFSTKDKKSKTRGLGLSVVQAIVRQMGGFIRVNSREGRTRFDVYFPSADRRRNDPSSA